MLVTHMSVYWMCQKEFLQFWHTLKREGGCGLPQRGNIWISKLYSSRHLSFSPVEVSLTSFLSFWLSQVVNDRFGWCLSIRNSIHTIIYHIKQKKEEKNSKVKFRRLRHTILENSFLLPIILKFLNSGQKNLRKMRQSTTIISFEIQHQRVGNFSI